MVKEMVLNKRLIELSSYVYGRMDGLHEIAVEFEVTSEDYHEIATLLYEHVFTIEIPAQSLVFTGEIKQYATSFTNLYEAGKVAVYSLIFREVRGDGQ